MSMIVCSEEKTLAIVGEFEFGPGASFCGWSISVFSGGKVKGFEGGFVIIPNIIHKDAGSRLRCYGHDVGRRVVGGKIWSDELEFALRTSGIQVPQADSVVCAAGEELIAAGRQGYACDSSGVGGEVADEALVVQLEQAQGVVLLGTCKEDIARMMCEAGEVNAILFAGDGFCFPAFFDVEDVHGLIVGGSDKEFSLVIEIEGGDTAFDAIRTGGSRELLFVSVGACS